MRADLIQVRTSFRSGSIFRRPVPAFQSKSSAYQGAVQVHIWGRVSFVMLIVEAIDLITTPIPCRKGGYRADGLPFWIFSLITPS